MREMLAQKQDTLARFKCCPRNKMGRNGWTALRHVLPHSILAKLLATPDKTKTDMLRRS
jgi:hypothetical protein